MYNNQKPVLPRLNEKGINYLYTLPLDRGGTRGVFGVYALKLN